MLIPRTRGAVSGALLILLGAWGAIVPLIGPSFGLTIGPDSTWDLTTGRFWLSLLPGLVVAVGGLLLLIARTRPLGVLGAWLGLAGGAWFVIGGPISQLWNDGVNQAGAATGGSGTRVLEQLTYFDGLGVLIVALAGIGLGRLLVRSVRDIELAEAAAADRTDDDSDTDDDTIVLDRNTRTGDRFDRDDDRAPATVAAPDNPTDVAIGVRHGAPAKERGRDSALARPGRK